jgi:hypothetical protein
MDLLSVVGAKFALEKALQTPLVDLLAARTLQSKLLTLVLQSKNAVIPPLSTNFVGEVVDLVPSSFELSVVNPWELTIALEVSLLGSGEKAG